MPRFETTRLICRPLTLDEYASFESKVEPKWTDLVNPYRHLIEGPNPLPHRIPRVKNDKEFAEIGLILAIDKISKVLVGSAGFHDFPDKNGMIEVGFGIVSELQGQGYGQELLIGMWKMIVKNPTVKILRYTVSPENFISLHIVKKFGFNHVGQQIDEEDGLELIFELERNEFLNRLGGDERI